jgi:hypothetical protein
VRSWEGINRTEEDKWRQIENEVESEIRRARERSNGNFLFFLVLKERKLEQN